MLGARGEVTFARFRPACLSASVRPVVSRPRPARHASAPRGSPASRPAAPRVRCPSPAPAKIRFPPSQAAVIVNRREPGAYFYRETRVPRAAVSAASVCLLKKKLGAPFARGFPSLIFVFKPQARTAEEYKLQERAILFLKAFCLLGLLRFRASVPALPSRLLQPLPVSLVPPVRLGAGHGSSEPLLSCSEPCKKSWRGSGWWGVGR